MAFTAKDVAALRERTGCGMMDCKKALTESDGDMDKAIDFLREKGLAAAAKKAGRIASEGIAFALANSDNTVGALVEINSETDFVAKNDEFIEFVKNVAQTVINQNPADLDALAAASCANSSKSVADELQDKILTIGENIKIRRFVRSEGCTHVYNHGDGRYGVLVNFKTDVASKPEFASFAKDVAMQIAAMAPQYVSEAEVPADVVEHEKKILTEQAMGEGKPANVAEKMVEGRLKKFFKDICLVDEPFVKDGDMSVGQFVEKTAKDLGGSIEILSFTRYEKGEGLEKKEEDFASEVAAQLG